MAGTDFILTRLYLLRHAEALPAAPGQHDFDRPLSDNGIAEAEILADRAADAGFEADRILSSTAERCRQTAEAMRRASAPDQEITAIDAIYEATAAVYLDLIAAQDDVSSLMLVGHNPAIQQTLERLIGKAEAEASLAGGYPTAGLAVLDIAGKDTSSGMLKASLRTFLRP